MILALGLFGHVMMSRAFTLRPPRKFQVELEPALRTERAYSKGSNDFRTRKASLRYEEWLGTTTVRVLTKRWSKNMVT